MPNFILRVVAVGLVLIGSITAFLPIPGGVLPLFLGVILLTMVSPQMQRLIQKARQRYVWLDRYCQQAEEKLKGPFPRLSEALAKTRPR